MEQLRTNGTYLYAGETQFFWLGDTAWEIFHRCTREEMLMYLDVRCGQGFNVIQCVALAEKDGIYTPNPYGVFPLKNDMLPQIVPDTDNGYWDNIDFFVAEVERRGMYVALLPTWGDKFNKCWGTGPEIFDSENALEYGRWIGNRYRDSKNIIWILGGDRELTEKRHFDVIYKMAEGIRESGCSQLISFHPNGGLSSSKYFSDEVWYDFHMLQSGHMEEYPQIEKMVESDLAISPQKPVLDAEPCYEDHPINFDAANGYMDAFNVRRRIYGSVLSGACGVTYGHNSIWCINRKPSVYAPYTWNKALFRPAAYQMQHLKNLIMTLDFARTRTIELNTNEEGCLRKSAITDGKVTLIYTPFGLPVTYSGNDVHSVKWFNPIDGSQIEAMENDGIYYPPSAGRGCDYVLIVEI